MKISIFLVTVFLSLNVFAGSSTQVYENSEEKVPVKEGYKPLDMTEYQKFQKTKPMNGKKTMSGACTDITGQTIKPGEAGYETCLQKINTDPNHKGPGSNLNMIYDNAD